MIDLTFWIMAAATVVSLGYVVVQERRIGRLARIAADALVERDGARLLAKARLMTIEHLRGEAVRRPSRGATGRFTKAKTVTIQDEAT